MRIADIRRAKGYSSQDALAESKQIHKTQISRVESGKDYRISSLLEVLAALEVDPWDIFGGSPKHSPKKPIELQVLLDKAEAVLREADPDDRLYFSGNIKVFFKGLRR